jgi:hypothetical protein
MAQRCVRPVAAVTLLSLLAAPLLNWLLIFRLGLGFAGAAYAVDAVQFFMAACLGGWRGAAGEWKRRAQGEGEGISQGVRRRTEGRFSSLLQVTLMPMPGTSTGC